MEMSLPVAPRSRQRWIGFHTATAQKEHAYQRACAVKAKGASGDHPQLIVEPLDESVGELGLDVSENAVLVFTDGLRGFHERLELGAGGPGEPAVELPLGILTAGLLEDGGEGLLEQVSTVEGGVVLLNCGELVPLLGGEVPRVFEESVPGLFDRGGLVGVVELVELTYLCPAHFVDCFGSELEDVKEVVDNLGPRHLSHDGFDKGGGHVDGDGFDLLGSLLPKLIEEGVEGLGALTLGGPDYAAPVVIDNGGDVAVSLSVAELVHADALEAVESFGVELVCDDALDDVAHGAPGYAHHPSDLSLVRDLCEVGGHLLEGPGEAAPRPGPGDELYANAAGGAFHAPWSVLENEPHRADTEVDPAYRFVTMVISGTYPAALLTARQAPGCLHWEDDTKLLEVDTGHEKTGDPYHYSGKLCDAHVFPPCFLAVVVNSKKHEKRALFNIWIAEWEEFSRGAAQAFGIWLRLPTPNAGEP